MKNNYNELIVLIFEVLGVLAFSVLVIFLGPLIGFIMSWIGGWIASIVAGNLICHGLNLLFDTARFTPSMLPWIAGALGWIGGFFKTITVKKKND